MMDSAAIEVALGLVFTYLVFSTLCSGINEIIAKLLNSRGKALYSTINALIGDAELASRFWQHSMVTGLVKSRSDATTTMAGLGSIEVVKAAADDGVGSISKEVAKVLPSYMSAATFATAIRDVAATPETPAAPGTPPVGARATIAAVTATVGADEQRIQTELEKWFNDAMDRLSGWYKRRTQRNLLALSVIVAIAFNVSTIHVADDLWRQPVLRAAVVQQAAQTPPSTATTQTPATLTNTKTLSDAESLPVGWTAANRQTHDWQWIWLIVGWFLTIGALTLGAPFWFDVLTRMNSLRSSGPPPSK